MSSIGALYYYLLRLSNVFDNHRQKSREKKLDHVQQRGDPLSRLWFKNTNELWKLNESWKDQNILSMRSTRSNTHTIELVIVSNYSQPCVKIWNKN